MGAEGADWHRSQAELVSALCSLATAFSWAWVQPPRVPVFQEFPSSSFILTGPVAEMGLSVGDKPAQGWHGLLMNVLASSFCTQKEQQKTASQLLNESQRGKKGEENLTDVPRLAPLTEGTSPLCMVSSSALALLTPAT